MNTSKIISSAIKKLGQLVSINVNDEVISFYAYVQPIHDKSKLYLESSYSSLGKIDRSHAIYYGPANNGGEFVFEGSIITTNGIDYTVKISEPFFVKEKTTYIWAVLQRSYSESGVV